MPSSRHRQVCLLFFVFVALLLQGCGSSQESVFTAADTTRTLKALEVTPSSGSLVTGTSLQLRATGVFSDDSRLELTSQVVWTSSDTKRVEVEDDGTARGVSAGSATVSAQIAGVSAQVTLTVRDADLEQIEVTPADLVLPSGLTRQFTATGRFSDGTFQDLSSSVEWESLTPEVASVSNVSPTRGQVRALESGTSVIRANFPQRSLSGEATIEVSAATLQSLEISTDLTVLFPGFSTQLRAVGHYSDGTAPDVTESVRWVSLDPTNGSVSDATGSKGRFIALSDPPSGTVRVQVELEGVTATFDLTILDVVVNSLSIYPPTALSSLGSRRQYTATAILSSGFVIDVTDQVTWSSDSADVTIASDDNELSKAGEAVVELSGSSNQTVEIRASLGTRSSSSTLTINSFAYVLEDTPPYRVSMYRIDAATGSLTSLGEPAVSSGTWAAAIAVDPTGRFAYVSQAQGGGFPAGFLAVYSIDPGTGVLTLRPDQFKARISPRAIAFGPIGTYLTCLYAANYLDDSVSAMAMDFGSGALTRLGSGAAMGPPHTEGPNPIAVHPNGRFVYTSNLLSESVSVYEVDGDTGAVTFSSKISPGYGDPSNIALDPTGRYAFVGFQRDTTSRVAMYEIDETTGALGATPLNSQANLSSVQQVVVDPSGQFVYATLAEGLVRAYIVNDPVRGFLAIANGGDTGDRADRLAFEASGRFLYVTNFPENVIAMFGKNSVNGGLANPVFFPSSGPRAIATTP